MKSATRRLMQQCRCALPISVSCSQQKKKAQSLLWLKYVAFVKRFEHMDIQSISTL